MPSLDVKSRCQFVVSILWEATSCGRVSFLHLVAVRGAVPVRVEIFLLLEYTWRSWFEFGSYGVELMDARWPCSAGVDRCPKFSSQAFSDCAVASFAVRVTNWLNSFEIIFVSSATNVLSACVAVTRFASARVWSCCISVKSAALACAVCMFAV